MIKISRAVKLVVIFAFLFVFIEPTTVVHSQYLGGYISTHSSYNLDITGNNISFSNGKVLWKYKLPSSWWLGPAIDSQGNIYVYGKNPKNSSYGPTIFSLNSKGKLLWNITVIRGDFDPASSPVLGKNNTVYVTTYYLPPGCGTVNVSNFLYAFSDVDGKLLWKFSFGRDGPFSDPVIGGDGTIYITAFGDKSIIYAINPNGTLKWRLEEETTNSSVIGPVLGLNDTVYFVYDTPYTSTLYALNPSDGSVKWKYNIQKKPYTFVVYPVVDNDGNIYVTTDQDCLYAITSDGTLKWRINITGYSGAPTIGLDGALYLTHYQFTDHHIYLYAIDSKNGNVLWKYFIGGNLSDPRSKVYIGKDNSVYVSSKGTIYALDMHGKVIGKIKANEDIVLRGIGRNDTLYVKSGPYLYAIGSYATDNVGNKGNNEWDYYIAVIGVIAAVAGIYLWKWKENKREKI